MEHLLPFNSFVGPCKLLICLTTKMTPGIIFPVALFLTELFVYQATAEQIRLAQMIYDKNDADFEDKVKQVVCLCIYTHKDKFFWLTTISTWTSLTMAPSLHRVLIQRNAVLCFAQLIEVTGKTQDECMVALHDCNEDVNRAINFLLESTSDTVRTFIHLLYLCSHTMWQFLLFCRDVKATNNAEFLSQYRCIL